MLRNAGENLNYSRPLPELAACTLPDEPLMTQQDIGDLFAHLFIHEQLFFNAIDHISEHHFEITTEGHFIAVWSAAKSLYLQRHTRPSLQEVQAEIQNSIVSNPVASRLVSHDQLFGPSGFLPWLLGRPTADLEIERGLTLARISHHRD